jgi:hypothetical protein
MKMLSNWLLIVAVPILALTLFRAYGTDDMVTGIVTDKERVSGADNSRYMVWVQHPDARNGVEVFENTDTWLRLKFNSADIQGLVIERATCTFKVNGWRWRLFSLNRNILAVDCTSDVVPVDPDAG